jgi:hypothetical protein
MAARPVDALQCFTFLTDNVPCWITRVTELAAYTSKKHAEFSEEFHRLAQTQPQEPQEQQPKNSSVHSIRPASALGNIPASKQETGSALITSGEGADVSRPIRPVVIYYDSHTQAELEQTVRDIGAARNSLRKGKMSQMTRISNLSLDMFTSQPRDSPRTMQLPVDSLRRTRPVEMDQKETATFEFAEKQLEIAQSLSEVAAHQFLRCGDCQKELDEVLAKFTIVLEMARTEACRLRTENEREAENKQAEGSRLLKEHIASSMKLADSFDDDKAPEPGIAAIEVDDAASDDSISIDIAVFRSNRFRA